MNKKTGDKIIEDCLKILKQQTHEATQKWLKDKGMSSLHIRNVKALEVVGLSNYMLQKILIGQLDQPNQLLVLLCEYNKNAQKCYEYSRLIKHFSQWDYQFEFIYRVSQSERLNQLGLYLRTRQTVTQSHINKAKKQLLSGITGQLEQWALLAKIIFKDRDEEDVIDQFTKVVKNHYLQVLSMKHSINGAQFLRICQIIDSSDPSIPALQTKAQNVSQLHDPVTAVIQETVLNGLTTQDKQLIRVLSYRDKNIARMLEQKHTKMVNMIGEQVNTLRKDINRQKQRYVQVVQQKNALIRLMDKMKQSTLRYVLNRNQATQLQVLQVLQSYNKKYSPKSMDVTKTIDVINNRRLIEIIQKQQLEKDDQE